MCFYSGRLYTVQRRHSMYKNWSYRMRLAVYSVMDQENVTLLDTLDLEGIARDPCVDHQSGHVYIPCGTGGVCVVRYEGSRLIPVKTLRCVVALSLAVVSTNTLYVCDWVHDAVFMVDVTQDRVRGRLQSPPEVWGDTPYSVAVLGDTVLVVYGGPSLVTYQHGVPTPGKVIPRLQGLGYEYRLTTDHHSSILVTDHVSSTVAVLDASGNLTHTIPIPGDRKAKDCAVVWEQLWVGCANGSIIVMSSRV